MLQPSEAESAGGFFGWWSSFWQRPGPELPEEEEPVEVRPTGPDPLYPRSLDEVVGMPDTVNLLRAEVTSCRAEGRLPRPMMLYGPAGSGKTMLCHVVAAELGMAIWPTCGPEWENQRRALETLDAVVEAYQRERRPILLLIDELDGVARPASYTLHSWFTSGYIMYRGSRLYAGLPMVIWATTNRPSGIPGPLRSRFGEKIFVDFLSPADLTSLVRQASPRLGLQLYDEAADWIGHNAAGEGRKALHILRSCRNYQGSEGVTMEVAKTALRLSGYFPGGLSRVQREILEFLKTAPNQTAGISSLAGFVGVGKDDIQDEEAYLFRSRAVEITGRGRRLTDSGRVVLG